MFAFGTHSLRELEGIDQQLIELSHMTLNYTPQDFIVFDGLRTQDEQRQLVASGASHTMNSKHLTGRAVDLVPWINGRARWELLPCIEIAKTVWCVAKLNNISLRWGAVWDKPFAELNPSMLLQEIRNYQDRQKAEGNTAFIDAVHYELL